jgi:hypothetical protein
MYGPSFFNFFFDEMDYVDDDEDVYEYTGIC